MYIILIHAEHNNGLFPSGVMNMNSHSTIIINSDLN